MRRPRAMETSVTDDYEYFRNKRTDRVYLSKSLRQLEQSKDSAGNIQQLSRPFRIVSKIVESTESHQFIKDGSEIALRITDGGRQEIKAKFYEDTRGVFTLTIQKYTLQSGAPHQTYFTFVNSEINTLYNFLRNIEILPLQGTGSQRLDDQFVSELVLTREQARSLFNDQPELVAELIKNQITASDVAELGHRRTQLIEFNRLMTDESHLEHVRTSLGENKRVEDVWQTFFERNYWIFGYGLNYFFNSALEGERLEQLVRGHDISHSGKRVDALLRTRGIVSALSFGEIKTHRTDLMKKVAKPYRAECWQVSDELSGGIAQVQKTVQVALENLGSRLDLTNEIGDPTGDALFLYQPKAFLVIGSLSEFQTPNGLNSQKYSSFELFRRNVTNPEILSFDELYERARFIVESAERSKEATPA
jgi:hypothetical protein